MGRKSKRAGNQDQTRPTECNKSVPTSGESLREVPRASTSLISSDYLIDAKVVAG